MRHLLMAATAAVVFAAPAEAAIFGGYVTGSSIAGISVGDAVSLRFAPIRFNDYGLGQAGGLGMATLATKTVAYHHISDTTVGASGRTGRYTQFAVTYGPGGFAEGRFEAEHYGSPQIYTGSFSLDGVGFVRFSGAEAPAVPEPASWAMMIAGFGLLGGAMRRRPRHATS